MHCSQELSVDLLEKKFKSVEERIAKAKVEMTDRVRISLRVFFCLVRRVD